MPPSIALLLCCMFILAAIMIDYRREPNVSGALWVPLIWLAIVASRPVGEWVNPRGELSLHPEEGSAIDQVSLIALICLAAYILQKRNFRLTQWWGGNLWLFLFLLYCGISIVWSDFPWVAFKRWIRAVGSLMMIFVVLSETNPIAAIGALVRRCTYVLIPLSLVLIKYYRSMAVEYNVWTGQEYLAGATTDKNALGRLCLVAGLFLFWDLIKTRRHENRGIWKLNRYLNMFLLVMVLWLLLKSHSSTSLGSMIVGISLIIGLGFSFIKTKVRYLGTFVIVSILTIFVLDQVFGLTEFVVTKVLGRNMTFTDRSFVWKDLLAMDTNPLWGVGYDSFWLGDRLKYFSYKHQVNEAHNGYLEVYLELGTIGLFLLGGFLINTFYNAKRSLMVDFDFGRLRLALLFIFLLYNVTESAYKASTLMFFVLMLLAIDIPGQLQLQNSANAVAKPAPPMSKPRRVAWRYKNSQEKPARATRKTAIGRES
jgi:exopolysaccharide production protein ExoQ